MSDELPEAEAREVIATRKFIAADQLSWDRSRENRAWLEFSCPLVDEQGITIPGLTAKLAYRTPARYDSCKYVFTVFKLQPAGQRRAYQLEVIPEADRGHNDDEARCYGPHEHIGELVQEVRVGHLDCRHHEQWFREFLRRAHVDFGGRYIGPFDGGLF